jgi:hypothetical protein
MANMHDIIELQDAPAETPLLDDLLDNLKTKDTITSLMRKVGADRLQKGDLLLKAVETVEEALESSRQETFFARGGNLPKLIEQTILMTESRTRGIFVDLSHEDALTFASRCPKGSLANLRAIADTLGFVLVPLEYVHDDIIDMAKPRKGANPARDFEEEMHDAFDLFVLGPLSIYDINKHITSDNDKIIYWDLTNDRIGAVEMVLPALKALNLRLDEVEKKVGQVETQIGHMSDQLAALETQIAEDRKRVAMENASLADRVRALEARQFARRDPLLFAVPKGTNIRTDNAFAVIGPCWGDDIPSTVFRSLGIEIIKGQRKKIGR